MAAAPAKVTVSPARQGEERRLATPDPGCL